MNDSMHPSIPPTPPADMAETHDRAKAFALVKAVATVLLLFGAFDVAMAALYGYLMVANNLLANFDGLLRLSVLAEMGQKLLFGALFIALGLALRQTRQWARPGAIGILAARFAVLAGLTAALVIHTYRLAGLDWTAIGSTAVSLIFSLFLYGGMAYILTRPGVKGLFEEK